MFSGEFQWLGKLLRTPKARNGHFWEARAWYISKILKLFFLPRTLPVLVPKTPPYFVMSPSVHFLFGQCFLGSRLVEFYSFDSVCIASFDSPRPFLSCNYQSQALSILLDHLKIFLLVSVLAALFQNACKYLNSMQFCLKYCGEVSQADGVSSNWAWYPRSTALLLISFSNLVFIMTLASGNLVAYCKAYTLTNSTHSSRREKASEGLLIV